MTVSVRLEPMTVQRFPSWAAESTSGFAAQQVGSGLMSEPEALAEAEQAFARILPQGLATPGHALWIGYDGEAEVGYLWLKFSEQSTGLDAYLYDIAVAEEHQGHGYGRALMLAGEDQARIQAADWIRLNVFGHNVAARRLYASLGYEPVGTMMTRRIDRTAPPTPEDGPGVRLVPMSKEQYVAYRERAEMGYAENIASSGMLPPAEAAEKAAEDFASLLPRGRDSPGHEFFTGYADEEPVGLLWLHFTDRSDGQHVFGYDFEVPEALRRRGYGSSVLAAAEQLCRGRGVTSVGLSVFGFNAAARGLYERSGFEVTSEQLKKHLH